MSAEIKCEVANLDGGLVVCATGHRQILGSYPKITTQNYLDEQQWDSGSCKAYKILDSYMTASLRTNNIKLLISGMALGWDTLFAVWAIRNKMPFIASVPFEGQENRWPDSSKNLYWFLLPQAIAIHTLGDSSTVDYRVLMQKRNEWMVDHSQAIYAWFDGSPGGTSNCVKYAQKNGRFVDNLYRFVK